MAPCLPLGFTVAGLLSVMISPRWVEHHLGDRGLGQVFKASLFGVPLPLCSCGVIPVGASLRRSGAGKGATTAFLLSTPQTGVDSVAVTYALLGPFLAVVRPVAALLTGFLGGGLVYFFDRNDHEVPVDEAPPASCSGESDCCEDDAAPERKTVFEGLTYGLVTLPRDIGRALIVGILLSGVISAVVKPHALEAYLGGGIWPMIVAMIVGVPLYVCATASTPIALSLIHAGLSPGAALVFLITGPATNLATVTTQWLLAQLYDRIEMDPTTHGNAVITGIEGEQHQVGVGRLGDRRGIRDRLGGVHRAVQQDGNPLDLDAHIPPDALFNRFGLPGYFDFLVSVAVGILPAD